ncbi:hypothetical protein BofuT4_uP085630.1 [Botrytis cinerea T4]|uniref:Uncharacterized protein n=1 Tax=Botryotinia fuckeliana (strain T4) TaxID=999810 RepID=G2YHL4_BOTF4|nr:hypothetical protein BofuT4_uP085630.1 [Botrytis cinerea T4]
MTGIERSPSSSPEPQVVTDDDGRVWVDASFTVRDPSSNAIFEMR